jgi:hypothetical protein
MIISLEKQIEEQREETKKVEEKTIQLGKNFRILISELIHSGYINVPERRKVLKRSMLDHEALMNLLTRKGIISKREFRKEIKQLVKKEKDSGSG